MKTEGIDFQKIRDWAQRERWTDSAIARQVGMTSAGVHKILRGTTQPLAVNLKNICDTIGLPIVDVFKTNKWPSR